jgi:hypothetical protein
VPSRREPSLEVGLIRGKLRLGHADLVEAKLAAEILDRGGQLLQLRCG